VPKTRWPVTVRWQDHDALAWAAPFAGMGLAAGMAMALLGLPPVDIHGPLHYLGVMDPLCGMTRGVRLFCLGQVSEAVRYNPAAPLLVLGALGALARAAWGAGDRPLVHRSPRSPRMGGRPRGAGDRGMGGKPAGPCGTPAHDTRAPHDAADRHGARRGGPHCRGVGVAAPPDNRPRRKRNSSPLIPRCRGARRGARTRPHRNDSPTYGPVQLVHSDIRDGETRLFSSQAAESAQQTAREQGPGRRSRRTSTSSRARRTAWACKSRSTSRSRCTTPQR
jgi:hypothetical protein